jgi:dienelactone hydrolase
VLAQRSDVSGKIGTTGYCMGGNASLRTATLFGG